MLMIVDNYLSVEKQKKKQKKFTGFTEVKMINSNTIEAYTPFPQDHIYHHRFKRYKYFRN